MKHTLKALCLAAALSTVGCTSTQPGKAIDKANYLDMASTGLALAVVDGAKEGNPAGIAMLAVKPFVGYGAEKLYAEDCIMLGMVANTATAVYGAATVNNVVLLAAGASTGGVAPVVGIAYGVYKYMTREHYECPAGDVRLDTLAAAYKAGDIDLFVEQFAPNAVTTDTTGLAALRIEYVLLFNTTNNRSIEWLVPQDDKGVSTMRVTVDGRYWDYTLLTAQTDAGITHFQWKEIK